MLIIRLQRVGRKNHAEFRMVVTEHTRGPKSANYLEILGHYNPHTSVITMDKERVLHWISMGAQVSDTVHNLLVTEKVITGNKINVLPRKTPIVKEESTDKKVEKESPKEEVVEKESSKEEAVEKKEEEAESKDTKEKKEDSKEA